MAEERAKGDVEVVEPSALAQSHARRVAESKATIPHVHLEIAAEGSPSTAAVVRACALALRDHPKLNGAYRDGHLELHTRINIGVAVPAQDSILFATIHDADGKEEERIAAEIDELAGRASDGAITQPELSGGTFSLVDLRPQGITRGSGVVRVGQAAQLTVGGTADSVNLTLACDGRILQGSDAPDFLAGVRNLLERR